MSAYPVMEHVCREASQLHAKTNIRTVSSVSKSRQGCELCRVASVPMQGSLCFLIFDQVVRP